LDEGKLSGKDDAQENIAALGLETKGLEVL
jgi:hypothetical protein